MAEIQYGRYDPYVDVFKALPDDAAIWRYIDLARLLALLEDRALHFTRSDRLGDPFEGSQTAGNREPPQDAPVDAQERERHREYWEAMAAWRKLSRQGIWVNCWNHSEVESDALWGRYAAAQQGVAIRSTFGRLTRSFGEPLPSRNERPPMPSPAGTPWPVYVGQVRYVDYNTATWQFDNKLWPFVHKRLSFEHEREVRALVTSGEDTEEGRVLRDVITPPGRLFAVDLATLIEAIYISPLASRWFSDLVKRVCARYSFGVEVRQSELAATPIF